MRLLIAAALIASPAIAAEPTDLSTAFARLSTEPVQTTGQIQFNGDLWIDTDTGERLALSTAVPRDILQKAEACEWPEGCRAAITGTLRVHGGILNLLAEKITFKE